MFVVVNGDVSPAVAPPVTTLLQSHSGAYTTFRTHNNGSELLFYQRHLRRLANSARILFESCPKLLFPPETNMASASLQKIKYLNWESFTESLVNDVMTKAMPCALKGKKSDTELAFTALVSGNLGKLVPDEKTSEEDVCRVFSMHLHVSLYTPLAFGVRKNGAHLAVVSHGRDVANAKYSDWVR